MENTLRNNTKFPQNRSDAYLWREVFGVFVDGSLASYRKANSNNSGSLNYVLGPVLRSVFSEEPFPEQQYQKLMQQATTCAEYLRQASIGPLSPEELARKKRSFDLIMEQTYKFLAQIKTHSLTMLQELEKNKESFSADLIAFNLVQLTREMIHYTFVLHHLLTQLPELEKTTPKVETELGGCVFAQHALNDTNPDLASNRKRKTHSDGAALGQLGLMPKPKEKPPEERVTQMSAHNCIT